MTDRLEEIRKRAANNAFLRRNRKLKDSIDTIMGEDIPYLLSELERQTEELSLAEDEAQYYRSWCDDDPQWSELHKQLLLHKKALDLACDSMPRQYTLPVYVDSQYWLDKAKEVIK